MNSNRLLSACLLLLLALLAGATSCTRPVAEGGWFGRGSGMSVRTDTADWSCEVDGANLRLRNGSKQVVVEDFVPEGGVEFWLDDPDEPHVRFRAKDGRTLDWRGDRVRQGDSELRLVEE